MQDGEIDLDELEPEAAEFIKLVRQLPEAEQDAVLRAMQLSAMEPESAPKTVAEMRELVQAFTKMH